MIVASVLILLAAAGVAFAPMVKFPAMPCIRPAAAPAVSYQAAIGDLASVRRRLLATGSLQDDQAKAIDVITLALVSGSDK